MSDTPRVDAEMGYYFKGHVCEPNDVNKAIVFARQLERELAIMTAAKNKALKALKSAHRTLMYDSDDSLQDIIAELEKIR